MRLKALNGAPIAGHLDFTESTLLPIDKCNGFQTEDASTDSSTPALKWRRLGAKDERLRTGWSQPYLPGAGIGFDQINKPIALPAVEQFSTLLEPDTTWDETTISLAEPGDDFLQHSLIFHDTLLSSQVAQDTVTDQTVTSSSFMTTSFGTTISEFSSPSRVDEHALVLQVPPKMTIASLGSVPSAQHLRSIYPQTPTPNAICVLMAPPERREVLVRKGGYKMDLYELTIGDDTKAGFKVTFWLRPQDSNNEQSNVQQALLQILESVRTGDILLLRNVALTSFRDTVHGQSLNPSIARARTTIDVLMKSNGVLVGQVGSLPAQVLESFMRVKKWARSHIAVTDGGSRKRSSSSAKRDGSRKRHLSSSINEESLPPDTMEAI